jgi:hypothetical protein
MQTINRDALKELLTPGREAPCVSIYLPLQRSHAHAHENAARLKSVLTDLEQRLSVLGLSPKGRVQFLAPARSFAEENLTVPVSAEAMALFVSRDAFHAVALPFPVRDILVVGTRFHVTPLLPILEADTQFYVLAMSRNACRLIRADADATIELQVPGMPLSLADAWKGMEHTGENLQFHSAGNGTAMFHGGGGAKDQDEIEITEYVRKVCRALDDGLKGVRAPLVFAGVEELWGLFRKECQHPGFADEPVHGSPDEMDAQELKQAALPIAQRLLGRGREAALKRFEAAVGAGRTSLLPLDILDAARQGRVETLLAAEGEAIWGGVDPQTGAVQLQEATTGKDEELIGLTAADVLANGGSVLVFPKEKMPEKAVIAALLRY